MKSITARFSKYINPDKMEPEKGSERKGRDLQKRILVILLKEGGGYSSDIADNIGSINIDYESWAIDSLNPFVLLSHKHCQSSAMHVKKLKEECELKSYRFIVSTGMAEYGIIGGGIRMSYGTVTSIWVDLIKAAISLPLHSSWIASDLDSEIAISPKVKKHAMDENVFWEL